MCAFLDTIADKYGMTPDNLKSDWANFSGMKPKAKKHTGPKLSDLKSKCKELDIPASGTKTILQDRIAAFERGEIKTITQTRDEKKAAKALLKASEEKKEKKSKKRSSGKSTKSSKSSKSSTSTKSSKSTSSGSSLSELKSQLKAASLPRTGNKADLVKRLEKFKADQADGKINYNSWKLPKIKDELKTRSIRIKAGINKEDMIKLLQDDDAGRKVDRQKPRSKKTKPVKNKPVKKTKLVDYDSDSDSCSSCYSDTCSDSCSSCYSESESESDSESDELEAAVALEKLRKQLGVLPAKVEEVN
jgi:hypothetical protein